MFIGHFAVGFGAKRAAPAASLGTLFLGAQLLDLLWPNLLLLGLERVEIAPGVTEVTPLDFTSYPITHSLLAVCGWGLLAGSAYWLLRRYPRGAVVLGLCVVSHWVLDLVVHRPDLPLYPGDAPRVGLGLWDSLPGTILVEGALFAAGLVLYARATRPKDRAGAVGLWGLAGLLVLIHLANLFGPPPPSTGMIAWAAQLQWLFVGAAYWLDRHRAARTPPGQRAVA
jgi:hypothetical protein